MNTAPRCYSDFLGVESSRTGSRFDTVSSISKGRHQHPFVSVISRVPVTLRVVKWARYQESSNGAAERIRQQSAGPLSGPCRTVGTTNFQGFSDLPTPCKSFCFLIRAKCQGSALTN